MRTIYPRMKSIMKIIQRMRIPVQNKILGRWEITYCRLTINKKVDLANEDNCGICYSTKYHNPTYINPDNNHIKNPIIDLE